MQNVIELNAAPFVRKNVCWFTSCSLADGLTDTVDIASCVGVEVPLPLEKRTPFRSIWRIIDVHRTGTRIQGCLGTAALLACSQDVVRAAKLRVVLQ